MQNWRVYSKKADFKAISDKFGIDQVVARIIRNRDVCGDEAVDKYLNGSKKDFYDPRSMKDMVKAVTLMASYIDSQQKIRIIGDYDIDGICSIYILFKGLKRVGADVDYDVPDRILDGYGINEELIKKSHAAGHDVIITCDNGIAAIEPVKFAKELGMHVIVTDHHNVQYEEIGGEKVYSLPEAEAIVDPKQADCEYPFKCLCGAGIAYKFICLMYEHYGVPKEETDELLQFAAFATVGDIVELQDENRILVKEGLKLLRHTENLGLNALISQTGVNKEILAAFHIGFVLGPCLNATGRLDSAKRAIELLLSTDHEIAEKYAGELKALNDERKKLTAEAAAEAIAMVNESHLKDDKILVVYLSDCHESIAGIVAGRVREAFYKPTIVLTKTEDGVKGSARSTEQYNIFEGLMGCKDLLTRFGGHPMAAGLSLQPENIELLRRRLNENCTLSEEDMVEKVWIDVPMPIEYISEKVISDLDCLEPFGKSNEKPIFADKHLVLMDVRKMGKNNEYMRAKVAKDNGFAINAVGFFPADELIEACKANKRVSVTYYPVINDFRGNITLQIRINSYIIE